MNVQDLDWTSIPRALPVLGRGMVLTLEITGVAVAAGLAWGTVLALLRLSRSRALSWLAAAYVNVFRTVPLVMVLLWFFLVVPAFLEELFGIPARATRASSPRWWRSRCSRRPITRRSSGPGSGASPAGRSAPRSRWG